MQHARERTVLRVFAADVNDAAVREFIREHVVDIRSSVDLSSASSTSSMSSQAACAAARARTQAPVVHLRSKTGPSGASSRAVHEPLEAEAREGVGKLLRAEGVGVDG
jgi:hypothetical protein